MNDETDMNRYFEFDLPLEIGNFYLFASVRIQSTKPKESPSMTDIQHIRLTETVSGAG